MTIDISERLQPSGDKHAIKSVSFAVELDGPLDKDAFAEISSLHPKLQQKLPRKIENTGFLVNVNPRIGLQATTPTPEISGIVFDRLMPDGTQEWSLDVSSKHVVVGGANYTRWNDMWAEARALFRVVLPTVLRSRSVTTIGLQYLDEFKWRGNRSDFRAEFLFQKGSNYIAPNIFELNDLWHNHHGFFRHCDSPCAHRGLTNINIDVADQEDFRVIAISTAHRALLPESIVDIDTLMGANDSTGTLDELLETMHQLNKELLGGLLTPDMQERINLNGKRSG